jgi:hypothetical protein
MTLSTLIGKRDTGSLATAIPAISATSFASADSAITVNILFQRL